jgi:hypothetical protein
MNLVIARRNSYFKTEMRSMPFLNLKYEEARQGWVMQQASNDQP